MTWADFRNNTNPACASSAPRASSPCNNDVFYSVSTDGAETWSDARNITPQDNARFGDSAQWQPTSRVSADGSHLWVAFYDRAYGNCEASGCNDITAVDISDPLSSSPGYSYSRVTTASLPNLLPGTNPLEAGFIGDRMALDLDSLGRIHIAWADTRQHAGTAPEEDVYYARIPPLAGPPAPPPPPPPPVGQPLPSAATTTTTGRALPRPARGRNEARFGTREDSPRPLLAWAGAARPRRAGGQGNRAETTRRLGSPAGIAREPRDRHRLRAKRPAGVRRVSARPS